MTKPAFPFWARDEDAGQIIVPPFQKVDRGWNAGQPAAAEYMNWYQNTVGKWVKGLQHQYADITVGSAAQVADSEADYTVDNFETNVANGNLVVFLSGTHTRTGSNIVITEDDVSFVGEPGAILDVGAFTVSATGARNFFRLRVINAATGEVTVDGAGSQTSLIGTDVSVLDVGAASAIGHGDASGVVQYATPISAPVLIAGVGAEATPSHTFLGFLDDGMWHPADNVLAWSVGGGEGMRLTTTGLGIKQTSPEHNLHIGTTVVASTGTPDTLSLGATFSDAAGENIKLFIFNNNSDKYGFSVSGGQLNYIVNNIANDHVFYAGTGGSLIEIMRLDGATGNVGIRITPTSPLHIKVGTGAGGVTAHSVADDLVLEMSATGGLSILTPGGSIDARIVFGSTAESNVAAIISYEFDQERMILSAGLQGVLTITGEQYLGINNFDPTLALDVNAKGGIHDDGQFCVKLTNKTGGNTVKGQIVEASATTARAFETAGGSSQEAIGIILEAGVPDGSEAWIVVAGTVEVLMDAGGSILKDRLVTSATAGSAEGWNVGGAVAKHMQEIGHVLAIQVGAGLVWSDVHFN